MGTRVNKPQGFGRSSRMYECEGRLLPSVTTILNAINKPALINWSAKVEREAIYAAAGKLWDDLPVNAALDRADFLALLDERVGPQKASDRKKNQAAEIGTQVHELAEWTLRTQLQQKVGDKPIIAEPAEWAFMSWEDWHKKANLVPERIEQTIWSNIHGYAGTLDVYGTTNMPGKRRGEKGMVDDWDYPLLGPRVKVVTDWKTGKGIYPEAILQIAAYGEALIEMGHAERGLCGLIVKVPKIVGDPDFETRFVTAEEMTAAHKVFLAVLELWKFLDKSGGL
jgi:hypothetical protein